MNGRLWVVVAAVVVTIVLTVPTGGFSAASADRSMEVAVVEDTDGIVDVDRRQVRLENGHHEDVPLFVVGNDVAREGLTVTATAVGDAACGRPPHVTAVSGPGQVAAGESGAVTADVVCAAARETGTVTVELVATTDDFQARMTRDVTIQCTGAGSGAPDGGVDNETETTGAA